MEQEHLGRLGQSDREEILSEVWAAEKKLIDGKEIIVKEPTLKLLSPSSVTTSSSSLQAKEIEPKKVKDTKPTKNSKYGRKESLEIKREENE